MGVKTESKNQAARFVEIIAGESDPVVDWRLIAESANAKKEGKPPRKLRGRFSEVNDKLTAANRAGYAVYVVINGTDGKGVTKDHVRHVRALPLDLDKASLPGAWDVAPCVVIETSP